MSAGQAPAQETSNARGEWVLVPRVPTDGQLRAMSVSRASDDEGEFPPLTDLIDCSGENKTRAVLRAAYAAMLAAAPPPAAARGDVRGLVAKWRLRSDPYHGMCADELESALAAEGVQAGEVERRDREADEFAAQIDQHIRWAVAGVPRRPSIAEMRNWQAALSQQPEARGVVDAQAQIDNVMGEIEQWFDTSGVDMTAATDSIIASAMSQQPEARGVVDDSALEALIGDAEGARWSDDEFRIDGRGLMKLLRDAAALTGERNG